MYICKLLYKHIDIRLGSAKESRFHNSRNREENMRRLSAIFAGTATLQLKPRPHRIRLRPGIVGRLAVGCPKCPTDACMIYCWVLSGIVSVEYRIYMDI